MAKREVRARHEAFEAWLKGRGTLEETERAFAPGMERVAPSGAAQGREAILADLRAAHGALGPAFAIAIEDVVALWSEGDAVLVRYVERQIVDSRETARRSTALMTRDAGAPEGVAWRFVQETWIASAEGGAGEDDA